MATRRAACPATMAVLLLLSLAGHAQSQSERGEAAGAEPLFVHQDTLAIRIEAPFTTLMRERSDSGQVAGTLSYTDPSGAERTLDVKLRTRGIYRRRKDTCEFAPIRLNFRKKQVEGSEFAGQDKLKLVTHCQNGNDAYEQYVLREYLAYKIFNVLTDYSFGARLLHATYVDTDRDGKAQTRYAFVIEDNDKLAERIGAAKAEVPTAEYARFDPELASLVTVFQYLIGNTDFSMIRPDAGKECCHNVELFAASPDLYIPVPYDFDFAGIVDAQYAEPHPSLNIRTVVRRRYRGICAHNDAAIAALDIFRSNEAAIVQLPAAIDGMDDRTRKKARRYIESFYEDIADTKSVEKNLVRACYGSR